MVTKEFLPFLKTPKNPYYYGSNQSTRQRRLNDGPVWPCTGALNTCTAANHRESISACRRDDLGVATVNVTRKRRITPARSIPAPLGAPAESRNHNLRRVRPVRPLDEAVLTTWKYTTGHRRKRGLSKFRSRSLPPFGKGAAKDRQPAREKGLCALQTCQIMVGAPAFMRGSSAFKLSGSRRTILLRL
jgi:hypothetical protein